MELLEGLKTRRSVRMYDTTKKIPHEDIEKILEAASYSPSAHNKQPWEFLVLEDADTLASLRTIQPWTSFAKNASCAVIVCSNTDEAFHRDKENEKWSYADVDGTIAAYSVLLAAHALGYGACFCGAAPMPLIIENLQEKSAGNTDFYTIKSFYYNFFYYDLECKFGQLLKLFWAIYNVKHMNQNT